MNPKYKINNLISELSKRDLPPISKDQIKWGYNHCLGKFAHISRGKMYCLECGYSWAPDHARKNQICPDCNAKLKMIGDYRTYCKDVAYMSVVTECGGFQVVSMVWVEKVMRMNFKAEYFAKEVMQHWIDENGNHTTMSLAVNGLSYACDSWVFSSEMKVKESLGGQKIEFRHNIAPYKSFPKAKILPVFKRNGFRGDFHSISPLEFFHKLIDNNNFETLLKLKQYDLLRLTAWGQIDHRARDAIKICIRNNYIVKDAKMWADYIDLLRYFKRDLHNAFYVCPENLNKSHDLLMNKKRKIQAKEKIERDKKHAIERIEKEKTEKENFIKEKSKFFGIYISDGSISIEPLKTIKEFIAEGDELHHCIFTNKYYSKKDSLILSAKKDGKRLETIEISLNRMEVAQCRGLLNESTEYHDQIISLVRRNINVIRQIVV